MYAFTHVNGLLVFAYLSTSGFSHPLEESPRLQASKRPNSPTHWKNHPTNQPLSGQKPPLTGTITPLTRLPTSRFPHPLEQNGQNHTPQMSGFLQRVEETARQATQTARHTRIPYAHIRWSRYSGARNSRHANSIRRIQSPLAGAAVLCRYPRRRRT